jgi:hypothetical protein
MKIHMRLYDFQSRETNLGLKLYAEIKRNVQNILGTGLILKLGGDSAGWYSEGIENIPTFLIPYTSAYYQRRYWL